MRKKVLLFGYSRCNFGDDMFIYMFAKRYENIDFYIHISEEKYKKAFSEQKNIYFIDVQRNVRDIEIDKYDAFCYIGGSIFIESEYALHEAEEFSYFIKKIKKINKPFFYITCNFGPYKTKKYLEKIRGNFSMAEGVCVRDFETYKLFKDIKSVSYAPDMVLTYPLKKGKKENKTIGISIINLKEREKFEKKIDIYEDYIKRIIIKFAKRGYKVYLISFCEFEKDKEEIEKITKIIPEKYIKNIEKIEYNGDIEWFIKKYSKIKYMVCTRFHSLILSILANQKIYNLCYSNKQKNFLRDYDLCKRIDMIENIEFETILKKYNFKRINNMKRKEIIKKAEGQFKHFEDWIIKK